MPLCAVASGKPLSKKLSQKEAFKSLNGNEKALVNTRIESEKRAYDERFRYEQATKEDLAQILIEERAFHATKIEEKYYILNNGIGFGNPVGGTILPNILNQIPQGLGNGNHIGLRALMKRLDFQWYIEAPLTMVGNNPIPAVVFRMIILYDMNRTQQLIPSNWLDIFNVNDPAAFLSIFAANGATSSMGINRYKILYDTGLVAQDAFTNSSSCGNVSVELDNLTVEFDNANNFTQGAIYLFQVVSNYSGANQIIDGAYTSRILFQEGEGRDI